MKHNTPNFVFFSQHVVSVLDMINVATFRSYNLHFLSFMWWQYCSTRSQREILLAAAEAGQAACVVRAYWADLSSIINYLLLIDSSSSNFRKYVAGISDLFNLHMLCGFQGDCQIWAALLWLRRSLFSLFGKKIYINRKQRIQHTELLRWLLYMFLLTCGHDLSFLWPWINTLRSQAKRLESNLWPCDV